MLTASLKVIFAIAIILWLILSGKLDFSLLAKSYQNGPEIFICVALLLLNLTLTATRWKLLLEVKSQTRLSLKDILKINWIGQFFSAFLPGVVTGDIVKLLYVKDLNPRFNKAFLLTSVLFDRIIGLTGLLLLGGVVCLLNYENLVMHGPKMKHLIHFNFLLFLGALFFVSCVFIPINLQNKVKNLMSYIPLIGVKLNHLFDQVWLFGTSIQTVISSILISIFVHFISIFSFFYISRPFYSSEISLAHLLGIIPIGFISTAIPISPSGAGVGHFVFDELFKLYNIQNGASLFNLYFLCGVIVNLLGVLPYLLAKKKHSLAEASDFESKN